MDLPREKGRNLYRCATNIMFKDKARNQEPLRTLMKKGRTVFGQPDLTRDSNK